VVCNLYRRWLFVKARERVSYVRVRLVNNLYPCIDGGFLGFVGWSGPVCRFSF
jgi:hypothetical protein